MACNSVDWAAIVTTFAAAMGAVFAGFSIWQSTNWNKLDRTFGHSPYRQPDFQKAREKLANISEFENLGMTAEQLLECLKGNHSDWKISERIGAQNVEAVVLVANYWGQMAHEYQLGLLNKSVACDVLRQNFMKFCWLFEKWLRSSRRCDQYKNTIDLYELWKK